LFLFFDPAPESQ
jgi:pimeloyl-ACP methyl ester carboxylesterase